VPVRRRRPDEGAEHLTDDQVLFLTDVFPTGYMGAEMCDITEGDTIAVWGAGPVGQFAAASAFLLGAHRVIVIDRYDYRLDVVRANTRAETLNYEQVDVRDALQEMTAGRGPDAVIDAVGLEAHHDNALLHSYDRVKQATRAETERGAALRQAILPAATAASSPWSASTAGSWTSSRSARS
jgi:threonine dehydrogenase-like Zn-dependent dehydrogenase